MIDITWEEINDIVSKAQTMERERIIALLEKLTWTRDCLYTETIDCTLCRINVHDAIAHIKGENE